MVLEFALLFQLVERRVSRLYRVEEGFSAVVVMFYLGKLDLFV